MTRRGPDAIRHATTVFFCAFVCACFVFWWLASILLRVSGQQDNVSSWTFWVSVLGLATFTVGYSVSASRVRTFLGPLAGSLRVSPRLMDDCEALAYEATILLALPAVLLSVIFFLHTMGVEYGTEDIPFAYQIVLYLHLFVGFLFLGLARDTPKERHRVITASLLIILPRLIVAMHLRRFFLAQAVVPILLIALARGWVRVSWRTAAFLFAAALFTVFVPALARGDLVSRPLVEEFVSGGAAPILLQEFADTDLSGRCPPLLVGLTEMTIPYRELGVCMTRSSHGGLVPASVGGIIGENVPTDTVDVAAGSGGNYLLGLYLTGGLAGIALGSAFFGFTCRCFVAWIGTRSAFAGIWAVCLSRSLLAPRGTLGYVYERIPSLLLAVAVALWFAWLANVLLERRREGMTG